MWHKNILGYNLLHLYYLVEPDKIKKEAFQIKLNEYTKRAEELKATLYISKIKIDTEETADKSSTSSNDEERSPKLCKKIFSSSKQLFIITCLNCHQCFILLFFYFITFN